MEKLNALDGLHAQAAELKAVGVSIRCAVAFRRRLQVLASKLAGPVTSAQAADRRYVSEEDGVCILCKVCRIRGAGVEGSLGRRGCRWGTLLAAVRTTGPGFRVRS